MNLEMYRREPIFIHRSEPRAASVEIENELNFVLTVTIQFEDLPASEQAMMFFCVWRMMHFDTPIGNAKKLIYF